ncbi:hypothetical protein EJ08DRAFT_18971 [Tothia fuscella]|uniref:Uncharacterized protein n=1 Tax=Tothia fuscella TaxID=1048955 RepID=A0A9P4NYD0_9PEZI|nr:hypothetical protein EJ08DRAFT_18971 [Tothia fuscella]
MYCQSSSQLFYSSRHIGTAGWGCKPQATLHHQYLAEILLVRWGKPLSQGIGITCIDVLLKLPLGMAPLGINYVLATCTEAIYKILEWLLCNYILCLPYCNAKLIIGELPIPLISLNIILYKTPDCLDRIQIRRVRRPEDWRNSSLCKFLKGLASSMPRGTILYKLEPWMHP